MLDSRTFRDFTIFDVLSRRKAWKSPVIFASIMTLSAIICFIMHKVDGAVLLGSILLIVGLGMPIVYFLSFFLNLMTLGCQPPFTFSSFRLLYACLFYLRESEHIYLSFSLISNPKSYLVPPCLKV